MKQFRFRLVIIVLAIGLSLYLLYPTYVDYQSNQDIKETLEQKTEQLITTNPGITKPQVDKIIRAKEDSILAANPDIVKNKNTIHNQFFLSFRSLKNT